MKSEENVRKFFKDAAIKTNPAMDRAVLDKVLIAHKKIKKNSSASMIPTIRRLIIKNPTTKLTAATVIIIACLTGLHLWKGTSSNVVLADVLAHVEQVKAFRCKGSFKMTGFTAPGAPYQWEVYFTYLESQEYGTKVRREILDPNGTKKLLGENYVLTQRNIEIDHVQKKYTCMEFGDAEIRQEQKGPSRYSNPRAFLNEIMTCKYENLGRSTMDGIETEEFHTTDPNCRGSGFGFKNAQVDVKLWVDVKTQLPVRYESLKSGLDEMDNKFSHHWVMRDFQWDISVDKSEFEPSVPLEDYIVLVEKPVGPVNEETVIQALKQFVELFGNYPGSLSVALNRAMQLELDKSSSPAAMRLKDELKELSEQKKMQRLMDVGMPIRLLFGFYIGLIEDRKDPAYYGIIVTPKDTNKILLRWKVSENEYRVIFGDLHAETISPERLAELEKDLPK